MSETNPASSKKMMTRSWFESERAPEKRITVKNVVLVRFREYL